MKLVILALLALPVTALADEAAQKKIDEAKAKSCQTTKASIVKLEARCPEEATQAKALTCVAADLSKALELHKACLARKAPPLPCKVLDADGKVLAELEPMEAPDCRAKAKETVTAKLCTAETKRRSFKYKIQRGDQTPLPGMIICK